MDVKVYSCEIFFFFLSIKCLLLSQIIIIAIIGCINADHLNIDLQPPVLPPANVANIFHESGITFVSPTSRNLEISSSVLAPPLPITHAFGYVSHNSNQPRELVRTHSSQQVPHGFHPSGINTNINGQITFHRHADLHDDDQSSHDVHVNILSPPADVVQARFVENENHGVHEINSRTQHFEYKVPLIRTVPEHHYEHHEHISDHHHQADTTATQHVEFNQRHPTFKHSTYGVPAPTFIPSQDEIDALPVFQNDKFLSPVVRHTNTPTTLSNIQPPAQTIENDFDPTFHSNKPTAHTRVNNFEPSVHSNHPTTHTREHIINGNNHYSNRFSLSDGTKVSEEGKLISPAAGWENVIAKTGEYEYTSPEGIPVRVKWIADHEGFRVLN